MVSGTSNRGSDKLLRGGIIMRTRNEGIVLVSLFAVFFLSSIALAVDCPIPDTGQTKCYDADGNEISPCPSPGQPYYGQDAQFPCNPQSYTSLAGGIMVQDNLTGLIWEAKQDKDDTPNYTNPHDADNTYTWYDGSSGTPGDGTDTLDFIAALNSSQFGGYSDWRLPTVIELSFIRNLGNFNPSINTGYFSNTVSSYYWSSTTYAGYPGYAWYVCFLYGYVLSYYKSSRSYVRAVRCGQCGSFDSSTTTTISGSTTTTTTQSCPTEEIYGEHSEETELLRYLRDKVLNQTPEGQEIIRLYYELSFTIVQMLEEDEEFRAQVKEMIDGVLIMLEEK
jgi:hypothetical protein